MKKLFKVGIVVIIISLIGFLGYKVFAKIQDKKEAAALTENLPSFKLTSLNGQPFSVTKLKKEQAVLLIFFNTDCEYCQHEAQDIQENLDSFKNTQILFMSSQEIPLLKQFAIDYKLNVANDQIHLLHDDGGTFAQAVEANSIPYMLVYGQDHNLVERLKGQTRSSKILELLDLEPSKP